MSLELAIALADRYHRSKKVARTYIDTFDCSPLTLGSVQLKDRMGLFIRTIGIARATSIKSGMANLVYNNKRLLFLFLRRTAVA